MLVCRPADVLPLLLALEHCLLFLATLCLACVQVGQYLRIGGRCSELSVGDALHIPFGLKIRFHLPLVAQLLPDVAIDFACDPQVSLLTAAFPWPRIGVVRPSWGIAFKLLGTRFATHFRRHGLASFGLAMRAGVLAMMALLRCLLAGWRSGCADAGACWRRRWRRWRWAGRPGIWGVVAGRFWPGLAVVPLLGPVCFGLAAQVGRQLCAGGARHAVGMLVCRPADVLPLLLALEHCLLFLATLCLACVQVGQYLRIGGRCSELSVGDALHIPFGLKIRFHLPLVAQLLPDVAIDFACDPQVSLLTAAFPWPRIGVVRPSWGIAFKLLGTRFATHFRRHGL